MTAPAVTACARPPLVTLTEAAARRLSAIRAAGAPGRVLRLSVRAKGCAGMSYDLSWSDAPVPGDEAVEQHGETVFVDPRATLWLAGTEMDWAEGRMSSGFVFRNPNETSRCGCGESFSA